jgi:hypothetical protein
LLLYLIWKISLLFRKRDFEFPPESVGKGVIPFHLKIDTDSCRGGRGSRGSKKNDLYQ